MQRLLNYANKVDTPMPEELSRLSKEELQRARAERLNEPAWRDSPLTEDWYLIRTKAGKEASVRNLLGQSLPEVFLPTMKTRVRRWGRLVSTIVPLFPCYIFASFVLQRDLKLVNYAHGVQGVISAGAEPLLVPHSIIDQLKQRCAQGPIEVLPKPLRRGEPVVILGGALNGLEAVFEQYLSGPQRVAILFSSFRVVVSASSVIPKEGA